MNILSKIFRKKESTGERKLDTVTHNVEAIKRDIQFDEKGSASMPCCGNCRASTLPFGIKENPMWCTNGNYAVDRKDCCNLWLERNTGFGA